MLVCLGDVELGAGLVLVVRVEVLDVRVVHHLGQHHPDHRDRNF